VVCLKEKGGENEKNWVADSYTSRFYWFYDEQWLCRCRKAMVASGSILGD
jgi:hypothetical protein